MEGSDRNPGDARAAAASDSSVPEWVAQNNAAAAGADWFLDHANRGQLLLERGQVSHAQEIFRATLAETRGRAELPARRDAGASRPMLSDGWSACAGRSPIPGGDGYHEKHPVYRRCEGAVGRAAVGARRCAVQDGSLERGTKGLRSRRGNRSRIEGPAGVGHRSRSPWHPGAEARSPRGSARTPRSCVATLSRD